MGSYDLDDHAWSRVNPLEHLERMSAPVLFMHGGKDPLGPVDAVRKATDELRSMGKPVALEIFPEEGHRIVHDRSIKRAWDTELAFYGEVWGFKTTSEITVPISNLR